ncbi:50S ribosome-binding GTPase [Candidatus Aerophobetes bacterium]|nr:50S ribosome-binding GTPase [Candidatus Aerophobetes bacterium]
MRVLLMGNPNVGKSVIFNRLTGIKVIASNYPGTTIEFLEGSIRIDGKKLKIIDAPGTYSLIPSDKAEEVAVNLLMREKTDLIINIVDATNLERNLYLTLQMREMEIPMLLDLNMIDIAKEQGIEINTTALQEEIGIPVVSTVAISGEGIQEIRQSIRKIVKR